MEKLALTNHAVQAIACANTQEALPLVRKSGRCVIVCFCAEQEHIVKTATLIKLVREQSRGLAVRVLVSIQFPGLAGDMIAEKLQAMGAHEVIREPVADRALAFKIDRHIRALPRERAGDSPLGVSEGERTSGNENRKEQVRRTPALELKSDCFLSLEGGTKRVGGRWIVRLFGPGPIAGRWVVAGNDPQGEQRFRWLPHDAADDAFIREPGEWMFTGIRIPEFINESWNFAGKKPHLKFVASNGQVLARKFGTAADGALELAQDSQLASELMVQLRTTFQKVIRSEERGFVDEDSHELRTFEKEVAALPPDDGGSTQEAGNATQGEAEYSEKQTRAGEESAEATAEKVPVVTAAPSSEPAAVRPPETEALGTPESEPLTTETAAKEALATIRADVKQRMANDSLPTSTEATRADPPELIRAPQTPGPTLGPLALAFLMSELLANRKKFDLQAAARRYCEYVASSCGHLRVELWILAPAGWKCVGTSAVMNPEGKLRGALAGGGSGAVAGARLLDGRTWTGWVPGPDGKPLGALIIDGEQANELTAEYVASIAEVTQGMLFRLVADASSEALNAA